MEDNDCVRFLQWALPQLGMRWAGFRRVHRQVCKRLTRRLDELALGDITAYQEELRHHPQEWRHLDTLCRVVVTRFYRDKRIFGELTDHILPQLATEASAAGQKQIHAWSIGSASGEEPYTLAIVWQLLLAGSFPETELTILGTEIDPQLVKRSRRACYKWSTVKNLPQPLRDAAFRHNDEHFCLRTELQRGVKFLQQDIRATLPDECFDLILCRNLVFTYFDEAQQQLLLRKIVNRLRPGGWLVVGIHEQLPPSYSGLHTVSARLGLYRRKVECLGTGQ